MIEVVSDVQTRAEGLRRFAEHLQDLTGLPCSEAVPQRSDAIVDGGSMYKFVGSLRRYTGDAVRYCFLDDGGSYSLSGSVGSGDEVLRIGLTFPRNGLYGDMLTVAGTLKVFTRYAAMLGEEPIWRSTDEDGFVDLAKLQTFLEAAIESEDRGLI